MDSSVNELLKMNNKELNELIKDQPSHVTEMILKIKQERLNLEKQENKEKAKKSALEETSNKSEQLSSSKMKESKPTIKSNKLSNMELLKKTEEDDEDIFKISKDVNCDIWKKMEKVYATESNQWKIITYFVKLCLRNNSLSTEYFSIKELVKWTSSKYNTVKSSLFRLERLNIITREAGIRGAHGKSRFKIASEQMKRFVIEKNTK